MNGAERERERGEPRTASEQERAEGSKRLKKWSGVPPNTLNAGPLDRAGGKRALESLKSMLIASAQLINTALKWDMFDYCIVTTRPQYDSDEWCKRAADTLQVEHYM